MADINQKPNRNVSGLENFKRAQYVAVAFPSQNKVAAEIDVPGSRPRHELWYYRAVFDGRDPIRFDAQIYERPLHMVAIDEYPRAVPIHPVDPAVLSLKRINLVNRDNQTSVSAGSERRKDEQRDAAERFQDLIILNHGSRTGPPVI